MAKGNPYHRPAGDERGGEFTNAPITATGNLSENEINKKLLAGTLFADAEDGYSTGDATSDAAIGNIVTKDKYTHQIWLKGHAAPRSEVFSSRDKARSFAESNKIKID